MTFAWHGFALEHPEDWAPVMLTGARPEGFVRIASPGRQSLQIRWKASKPTVDLKSVLASYLERLSQDARKAKTEFRSHIDEDGERLTYRYSFGHHGRGAILRSELCGRVFFLEATSTKNDSLLPTFKKLLDSFEVVEEPERWALFGLSLKLPKGLEVESKKLEAGRTKLVLTCKKARIEAQRMAFAEQLVAKHGLEPWARSIIELPKAESESSEKGIEFLQRGSLLSSPVFAMAQVQPERDQIVVVRVSTRDNARRPSWDWFE